MGSRRADTDEGEPVSGAAPTARPRRSASRRPEVVWSGGDDSDLPVEAVPEQPPRRRRRNTDDSWARPLTDPGSRPAADPWSRSAEPEPEYRPAVDPWDASGVHTWQSPVADDRWERPGGASRWEQSDSTGQWDRFTDTAQWDRTDVGRWGPVTADRDEADRRDTGGFDRRDRDDTDRWDRGEVDRRDRGGVDRWERSVPPRSSQPVTGGEGWPWGEQPEGFWSGTRLAGDDPRWMDPPTSAPRSPVVGYTAPRPRAAPRRRAEPASGRAVATASLRDRIGSVGAGSWNRRLEDDLLDPDPGGPLRPLVYTAACYLVPAVLVFLWLLTLDGQPPAGCVTDISGGGCEPPRAHAFGSLVAAAPRFGLSLAEQSGGGGAAAPGRDDLAVGDGGAGGGGGRWWPVHGVDQRDHRSADRLTCAVPLRRRPLSRRRPGRGAPTHRRPSRPGGRHGCCRVRRSGVRDR